MALAHCQLRSSDQDFIPDKVLRLSGLGRIRDNLARHERSNVLDLGPPVNSNISYFREFNCRIRIQNLYQELIDHPRYRSALSAGDSEIANGDIAHIFDEMLSDCRGVHYNLILLWDLIDYLHRQALTVLMGSLAGYCQRGAYLYMVSSTNRLIPSVAARFSLLSDNQIRYQPVSDELIAGPRHSIRAIERMLPGFHLERCFLLPEGLQEYIWKAALD